MIKQLYALIRAILIDRGLKKAFQSFDRILETVEKVEIQICEQKEFFDVEVCELTESKLQMQRHYDELIKENRLSIDALDDSLRKSKKLASRVKSFID